MPVLAVGGEKSFGKTMAVVMRATATDVREAVVPDAGHWVMDENPAFTVALLSDFTGEKQRAAGDLRLAPGEIKFANAGAGTGTSAVEGIQMVDVKGNPDQVGPYTIVLRIPAHMKIAAHCHPDDRVATILSGTWYFGYGEQASESALKGTPGGQPLLPSHRAGCILPKPATSPSSCRSPAPAHLGRSPCRGHGGSTEALM